MKEAAGMELPDEELVAQVQRGETAAFNILVERYQRRIYALVLGMVHHQEDAWDLAQEIFLKAYRSLKGFKGNAQFYTWLYRIALNHSIDFQRKKKGTPFVFSEAEMTEKIPDLSDPPDVKAMTDELKRKLHQALALLPDDQRTVVILREIDELSYQEIAHIAQCSIGTVMSRLHYGRKKLQAVLKILFKHWELSSKGSFK